MPEMANELALPEAVSVLGGVVPELVLTVVKVLGLARHSSAYKLKEREVTAQ